MVNQELWQFWCARRFAWVALLALALFAAWLRFDGQQWDDRSLPHPDERFNTMVAAQLHTGRLAFQESVDRDARRALCRARNGGPEGIGGWFDTQCSDFNPANVGYPGYPYGQLPLVSVRLLAEFAVAAGGPADLAEYGGIVLVGRTFSAACDVLTLLATFLLGRLLWGTTVGVLAAAFYAVAVLPIQAAHFWTVDTSATLFATVALVFLVRLARFGQKADALGFGAAFGFGLACKISIAPLVVLLPLALYWAPALPGTSPTNPIRRLALRGPELALAVIGVLACFRLASPYAFVGPTWSDAWPVAPFFEQIQEARRLAAGGVDFPPNWQWLARVPWLDPGRDLLVWGLGPLLGGAVAFGVVAGALRLPRATRTARSRSIVWLWVVGYFVWMGQQWVASLRYFLPLYPALCVLAAGWLVGWWRRRRFACRHHKAAARPSAPVLVIATVLVGTILWSLAYHHIPVTLHPYVAATHWMLRHVEAPVSAPIEAADGTAPLVNWPASAALGDATATNVVVSAANPADGTISRLRLHRVTLLHAAPAPTMRLELVDRHGRTIGATATIDLPFGAAAVPGAVIDGIELPLTTPVALPGGEMVGLRLVVRGGSIRLSGARLIQEGAWNDTVPTRVVRLPGAGALDLAGPSGTAARNGEGVDPFGQGYYVPLDLDMATEDDARKRTRLLERLDAGEWLVVTNQRFYASMTRNPLRFPLATRFYDALFGGELGYSVALVAASPPRLAGIAIADQALPTSGQSIGSRPWAGWMPEEAFSVYDHPAVFVFRKDSSYTRAAAERALSGLELTDVRTALGQAKPALAGRLAWSTAEASAAPDGLLRDSGAPRRPAAATAGDRVGGGLSQAITALWWYALSLVLGLLAWPWLATLWPELPDRGYGVARIVGLVVLALPAWWLAAVGVPAWTGVGLTALLCVFAAATALAVWSRWRRGVRIRPPALRVALVAEFAFAALFVVGIGLRLANPDLWAPSLGGEKPMDFALFNRVLATDAFPPADPWFSGGRLNYYYFGWVLAGVLTKLTGAPASLAYNLALPTWFAMTGVAAGMLAHNAVARAKPQAAAPTSAWIAAAVALAATVLLGNLDLPRALAPAVDDVSHALAGGAPVTAEALGDALRRHSERWFWAPSRTVGELPGASHEINEFPAFSFLFGDLHAHVLALPLQLLALCALGGLAASAFATPPPDSPQGLRRLAQVAAVGVPVGLLRATNTWDWPLYLALAVAVTTAAAWVDVLPRARRPGRGAIDVLPGIVGVLALLLAVQWLVAWPFRSFVTGAVGLHLFEGKATPLVAWLAMQGWFLVAIGAWSLALARGRAPTPPTDPRARGLLAGLRLVRWGGIAATIVALLVASIRGSDVPALYAQIALVAWLLEVLWLYARAFDERAGLLLAIVGFALAVVVEGVVVGRDIGRMNTFFKFHLQAWMLLAIAAGIAVGRLVGTARSRRRSLPWKGPFAVVTLVAAAYLPLATYGRSQARFDPRAELTLDGMAFLDYAIHTVNGRRLPLADDAKIIHWLRTNTAPDDVILEAQLPEYQWGSRLSVHSGRPTVLGYRHHQTQQRPLPALADAIELRRHNVAAIYETTDLARKIAALRHYDVRYVAVGGLERAVYPAAGLAGFDELVGSGALEVALAAGADRVYRVPGAAGTMPPRGPAW